MTKIVIDMDEEDFENLILDASLWGTNDELLNQAMQGRFSPMSNRETIDFSYRYLYWVDNDWSKVVLLRAFLMSMGHPCQVLSDEAPDPDSGYAIVTNYASARTHTKDTA